MERGEEGNPFDNINISSEPITIEDTNFGPNHEDGVKEFNRSKVIQDDSKSSSSFN